MLTPLNVDYIFTIQKKESLINQCVGRAVLFLFGYRIISAGSPGMTPGNSFRS